MAMTSFVRWATEATASFPSIVTIFRCFRSLDMVPPPFGPRLGVPEGEAFYPGPGAMCPSRNRNRSPRPGQRSLTEVKWRRASSPRRAHVDRLAALHRLQHLHVAEPGRVHLQGVGGEKDQV